HSCVPEALLEQLLLFPVKAGVAYFLTLPVFFTIQLLLTYATFENHFLTRLDISPVERKMTLTSSAATYGVPDQMTSNSFRRYCSPSNPASGFGPLQYISRSK
ncbi:hypothetical protein PHET_12282, partial [Paragonimus heterotremus]